MIGVTAARSEELLPLRGRLRVVGTIDEETDRRDHQQGWQIHLAHQEICPKNRSHLSVRGQYGDRIDASPDCPSLPKKFWPVSLNGELWLGRAETSIRSKFGAPSKTIENWEQFYYSGKTRGDGKCAPDGYDVINGFSIKIEGGVVRDVEATQVTSC